MKRIFYAIMALAALTACAGNQVGVITEPVSASTNIQGREYPKINPDLSVEFRVNAPEAESVAVDICSKVYPMTRNEDGVWVVTTDPQEPGFHYYFLVVDGVRVSDPSSQLFFGCSVMASAIDIPEAGCDFYLPKKPRA